MTVFGPATQLISEGKQLKFPKHNLGTLVGCRSKESEHPECPKLSTQQFIVFKCS